MATDAHNVRPMCYDVFTREKGNEMAPNFTAWLLSVDAALDNITGGAFSDLNDLPDCTDMWDLWDIGYTPREAVAQVLVDNGMIELVPQSLLDHLQL
jgi:hypothetical protein